jgi:autotransporter-associated beta strand protein
MAYADFQDITGAGTSGWNLSSITGGSGDCGGTSGITVSTGINCYMKTGASVGWSGANWYTTSGGSTAARNPLPQDTAVFDANSITAASVVITIDVSRISGMNWTGVTNSPELKWSTSPTFFGSLTFISAMSFDCQGYTTTFQNRGAISIDMGGVAWSGLNGAIVQNGPGGTINQQSDFTTSVLPISWTSGTWNGNSHALTVGSNTASLVNGGTLNVGSGGAGFSYLTLSSGTLEMNGNNISVTGATTISGGVLNLSGQLDAGTNDITVSGGTVNDTGAAGELKGEDVIFSGGNAVVRKITAVDNVTIESSGFLVLTGSATWGADWDISGSSATFKTAGTPTWSAASVTIVNGGSWTFC